MESNNPQKYLEEHHHITETAIGLAKVALLEGDVNEALSHLDKASQRIDEATREYLPETSKLLDQLRGNDKWK